MSLINRWGTEPAKKAYFLREIRYRQAMNRLALTEGATAVVEENKMFFKLQSRIMSKEDLKNMVRGRYIEPTLANSDLVLPQIIGINREAQNCGIFSYAPILKFLKGKVEGLSEALMALLDSKGCNLFALVTGSQSDNYGNLAAVLCVDIKDRSRLFRAFQLRRKRATEVTLTPGQYNEMFMKTFDADLWMEREAFKKDVS